MHGLFYKAMKAALKTELPIYTSTYTDAVSLPAIVVSASFAQNDDDALANNWTFDANVEFKLIMPAEGDGATARLEAEESALLTALHDLGAYAINEAADNPELLFYTGFIPESIADWEVSDEFPEPALYLSICGRFRVQR